MRQVWCAAGLALAAAVAAANAGAQELIVNGGFESGSVAGWTRQLWPESGGDFQVVGAGAGAFSGLPQVGPRSGAFYALTDQSDAGAYALYQTFTVRAAPTAATLRFALSVASYGTPTAAGTAFDPFGAPRQFARVDLFAGTLGDGFTAATPLRTFYSGPGAAVLTGPQPWQLFTFDVTSLLATPGAYTLRFAEVDNTGFFNLGVDDVSLQLGAASTVPEPATWALVGAGLTVVGAAAARRTRA